MIIEVSIHFFFSYINLQLNGTVQITTEWTKLIYISEQSKVKHLKMKYMSSYNLNLVKIIYHARNSNTGIAMVVTMQIPTNTTKSSPLVIPFFFPTICPAELTYFSGSLSRGI